MTDKMPPPLARATQAVNGSRKAYVCGDCGAPLPLMPNGFPSPSRKRCPACHRLREAARQRAYYKAKRLAAGGVRMHCACGNPLPVLANGLPHAMRKNCARCKFKKLSVVRSRWGDRKRRKERAELLATCEAKINALIGDAYARHGPALAAQIIAKSMVLMSKHRYGLEAYTELLAKHIEDQQT